jgi:hypothetical protein
MLLAYAIFSNYKLSFTERKNRIGKEHLPFSEILIRLYYVIWLAAQRLNFKFGLVKFSRVGSVRGKELKNYMGNASQRRAIDFVSISAIGISVLAIALSLIFLWQILK